MLKLVDETVSEDVLLKQFPTLILLAGRRCHWADNLSMWSDQHFIDPNATSFCVDPLSDPTEVMSQKLLTV